MKTKFEFTRKMEISNWIGLNDTIKNVTKFFEEEFKNTPVDMTLKLDEKYLHQTIVTEDSNYVEKILKFVRLVKD